MKGDDEFMKLGIAHAAAGQPRYKFQEPHLQKLYNRGYDLESAVLKVMKVRCSRCGEIFQGSGQYRMCQMCR